MKQKKPQARLHVGTESLSLEQMHDFADVFMNAIHVAYDGKSINAGAVGMALIASGMGVLRDAGFEQVKARVVDFAGAIDLDDIKPFNPDTH